MRIDVPITGFIVNKNFQIVIPKIIKDAMGLKAGDKIEWSNIDVKEGEFTCRIKRIPKGRQKTLETGLNK
jgi:AbrB family looped-hinge helix DNA binding protein